jgi:D-xylose transport system permease protein
MQIGRRRLSVPINLRTFAIVIAIIMLWIVFAIASEGSFISQRNLSNLFRQMSIVGVLGTGALMVIVSGNIDLSVGLLAGFSGCVGAMLMSYHGWGTIPALGVMLAAGAIFGLAQGYVVAYVGVPSFIVTLGGQMVLRGFTLGLTKGVTITPINSSFLLFGQAYFGSLASWTMGILVIIVLFIGTLSSRRSNAKYNFKNAALAIDLLKWVIWSCLIVVFVLFMTGYEGIPVPVFIVLLLATILTFVAEGTTFGRRIYIIGGNVEAARYSGINVRASLIAVFLLNGAIAAVAGVLLTSRQAAGLPSGGANMELDAIAAAVIGGASMMGGSGRVFGALIGAMLMATIDNGMSLLNMETFWQYIVKGLILVSAVAFDILSKRGGSEAGSKGERKAAIEA